MKKWFTVIGWIILFGFFFSVANYFQSLKFALLVATFDTLMLLIIYQATVKILFPRFFKHTRQFLLISLLVIIGFSFIYFLIDIYLIPKVQDDSFEHPPAFLYFVRMLMFTSLIFFIATSKSLIEHTNRLIANEKKLTEEKLNTELKLLKAQINPHFIFNALNNIYSLTYIQAQNAPDSVLKLSEMLRYVFYDCGKEHVQLNSEIHYIENFIAFQQMKSEFTQNIKLTTDITTSTVEIAPMLFIPFIENAFKYSRIEENEEEHIDIVISANKQEIKFMISNGFDTKNKPLSGNGVGIKNVQQRLNIIYPDSHELIIDERNDIYSVELSIFNQQA